MPILKKKNKTPKHLEIHDFAQGSGQVVVVRGVLRVALDGVLVLVDRGLPVLGPERVVAPLLGRFRQLWVDVPEGCLV